MAPAALPECSQGERDRDRTETETDTETGKDNAYRVRAAVCAVQSKFDSFH